MLTLESAVRLLSPVTVPADPISKWTKNVLFTQFKVEADNLRETLKARKNEKERRKDEQLIMRSI